MGDATWGRVKVEYPGGKPRASGCKHGTGAASQWVGSSKRLRDAAHTLPQGKEGGGGWGRGGWEVGVSKDPTIYKGSPRHLHDTYPLQSHR
jgi:hypothetical protein